MIAHRASLVKMVTSVHEEMTVCPWEFLRFSLHPTKLKISSFVPVEV